MYAVYFEKLGRRERKSGLTSLSVEIGGADGGECGGNGDRDGELERERP